MRRKYIPAYVECLQHNQMGGNEETKKMDEELPEATILLFRRLAHTQAGLTCMVAPTLAPRSCPVMHRRALAQALSCSLFRNRLRVTSAKLQQLRPRLRVVAGLAGSAAPRRQSRTSRRSRLQTASSARRRSSTCGSWSTSRRRRLMSVGL